MLDARNKLKLRGEGIKVAVVASGVYYLHPALGGCFGPGCKVAFGYDLVGDLYDGSNDPSPDSDPIDDCSASAYGTHVAGIVAANAYNLSSGPFATHFPFTGVAPGATIGAYRVFGCDGNGAFDVITAAAYRAAADGADVINLSILSPVDYSDSYFNTAMSRVSAAGHIVVHPTGDDGSSGIFSDGSSGSQVLSVGSYDSAVRTYSTITVDGIAYPYTPSSSNNSFHFPDTLKVIVNGMYVYLNFLLSYCIVPNYYDVCVDVNATRNDVKNDGCEAVNPAPSAGKTVLLRWGSGCGSRKRCDNAYLAGYARCLLYSNNDVMLDVLGSSFIPSVFISKSAGAAIVSDVKAHGLPVVVVTSDDVVGSLSTAGTVSSFSSAGLTTELAIKPDVGGIGGYVYSTISPFAMKSQGLTTPYAVQYSTVLAASYLSGSIALLLQRKTARNICQYSGFCYSDRDCYPGNKCSITSPYYSQCIPDPSTYFDPAVTNCVANFGNCAGGKTCCDPGSSCIFESASYSSCRQPKTNAVNSPCADPKGYLPTTSPTASPSRAPTSSPTRPTPSPTRKPTYVSTSSPSKSPSYKPSTAAPSKSFPPSVSPSKSPSFKPSTVVPSISISPSVSPSKSPSFKPSTGAPSKSFSPSASPFKLASVKLLASTSQTTVHVKTSTSTSPTSSWTPKARDFYSIRTYLQNTATPRPKSGFQFLDSVVSQVRFVCFWFHFC